MRIHSCPLHPRTSPAGCLPGHLGSLFAFLSFPTCPHLPTSVKMKPSSQVDLTLLMVPQLNQRLALASGTQSSLQAWVRCRAQWRREKRTHDPLPFFLACHLQSWATSHCGATSVGDARNKPGGGSVSRREMSESPG